MRAYFLRRLLLIPPTLIGVTLIVFILTRFVPGGPVEALLSQMRRASAEGGMRGGSVSQKQALDEEQMDQLKEYYKLDDKNFLRAYLKWLGAWPSETHRKKVEFKAGENEQPVRTPLTRERLVVHRDREGVFRVTTPDGGEAGEWKVHGLGFRKPAPGAPPEEPDAPKTERAEIYQARISGVLTGDLGRSSRYQDTVTGMIAERLPISAYYGFMTLLISYLISIPLGVLKALRHNRLFDNLTSILVFAGYAIPSFVLGTLLVTWLAVRIGWFPAGGFTSYDFVDKSAVGKVGDVLVHSALPLLCYCIGSFAFLTMLMKNQLMDNVAADYIRTAVAKGLTYPEAVRRHALRNAFIPIATTFGGITTALVTGSFLIERVFDINGFGLLFFEAIIDRDYPVVMGTTLLTAFLIVAGNILSDLTVAFVDPRVKFD